MFIEGSLESLHLANLANIAEQTYDLTRGSRRLATAVAVCIIIAAIAIVTRYEMGNRFLATNTAPIAETVNLWDTGAFRGQQPGPLQSVSLPAALVRVRIVLPRFSSPGRYVVAVTHIRAEMD